MEIIAPVVLLGSGIIIWMLLPWAQSLFTPVIDWVLDKLEEDAREGR